MRSVAQDEEIRGKPEEAPARDTESRSSHVRVIRGGSARARATCRFPRSRAGVSMVARCSAPSSSTASWCRVSHNGSVTGRPDGTSGRSRPPHSAPSLLVLALFVRPSGPGSRASSQPPSRACSRIIWTTDARLTHHSALRFAARGFSCLTSQSAQAAGRNPRCSIVEPESAVSVDPGLPARKPATRKAHRLQLSSGRPRRAHGPAKKSRKQSPDSRKKDSCHA